VIARLREARATVPEPSMSTSSSDVTGQQELDGGLAEILADFPEVACAWVFGSRARGEARRDSDLDLGLLLRTRGKSAKDVYESVLTLAARAERLVGGARVDVVLLEDQGPIFCHRVLSEGRLVYDADPDRRIDFESDTYVRYFDFLPTYELAARTAAQGMRDWLEKRR
jgi:predicted nucleotidyltransferase